MKPYRFYIIIVLLIMTGASYLIIESANNSESFTIQKTTLEKNKTVISDFALVLDSPSIETKEKQVIEKWKNTSLEQSEWGEAVSGVKNRMDTDDKVIALTFDACGGPYGDDYDEELIHFLRSEQIPATLFFNARWIESNQEIFVDLAEDPLFSVQNHGTEHLPLSVTGNTAWGIQGTFSAEDVVEEVMDNQHLMTELTGESPKYFRSGTAHYDNVAVEIVEDLGLTVVNYDVLGDAGATFSASQVEEALLQSTSGSIPLLHMNQPNSGTAEGVMNAIPLLESQGYTFVRLDGQTLIE
ncbi:polysaccharide deacetylase [Salipaludibacillus keqinensis]|uniref:Polysaccharide deacetylase n=1 Tax=Salipaludibacillus keqinensis TaxID=2045207 RepID=A0A323TJP4_9BACI|nr:polysaccharide deacetylase family protein [Salipaludibacillus keqinensis]PYZ93837.1 polysaccharide deacetylase [Salipaludibacillus keqinensis]